jgi:hypothetical protein
MADLKHRAIPDDDPVKRRGNDETDDRYPYGGDRLRKRTVIRASGRRTTVRGPATSARGTSLRSRTVK